MKKLRLIISFILIISPLTLTFANQETASAKELVSIKEIEPFTYCCLSHKGPFSDMAQVIGTFIPTFQNQNLFPAGPLIGIYYDDPNQVKPEDLTWEIGFPVSPQIAIEAPLEKKQWNFTTIASAVHVGLYEEIERTITKMLEFMTTKGYVQAGPLMERYLDMEPSKVKPEELKTEVWIPCQKVGN